MFEGMEAFKGEKKLRVLQAVLKSSVRLVLLGHTLGTVYLVLRRL